MKAFFTFEIEMDDMTPDTVEQEARSIYNTYFIPEADVILTVNLSDDGTETEYTLDAEGWHSAE